MDKLLAIHHRHFTILTGACIMYEYTNTNISVTERKQTSGRIYYQNKPFHSIKRPSPSAMN